MAPSEIAVDGGFFEVCELLLSWKAHLDFIDSTCRNCILKMSQHLAGEVAGAPRPGSGLLKVAASFVALPAMSWNTFAMGTELWRACGES